MEVRIGRRVYNVEFPTEAQKPKYGARKRTMALVKTHCVITSSTNMSMVRASASQNYRDELNWQTGRKFALKRALAKARIKKESRTVFWNRFKEE